MNSLGQHMRWVRLGLYALSAALSPPCPHVRFADRGFPPSVPPRNKTNERLWRKRKLPLHSDPRPRNGSYFSACNAEDPGSILGRGVILDRVMAHHGQYSSTLRSSQVLSPMILLVDGRLALQHFVAITKRPLPSPRNSQLRHCAVDVLAKSLTPARLEPAIPGSVGRCLIHWATGPIA